MSKKIKFGLIGRKLVHSYSPQIHELLSDYEYKLYELEPKELDDFFKDCPLDGFNVTIPYKEKVIPYLDDISDTARKIGSVNTVIRRPDGKLFGDNTDYYGFLYLLKSNGINPSGKETVVFGSGGSSKTITAALSAMGASKITVVSRRGTYNYSNLDLVSSAQIVVNTTPVGMYPKTGEAVADLAVFKKCRAVVDIIFNPARTKLLMDAGRLGIQGVNGLAMLVAQAKRAAEIFLERPIPDDKIKSITARIAREMMNVVLIGMPGCGKSSVGLRIAELTGRKFADTDEIIKEKAGTDIPSIFKSRGEDGFRRLETETLNETCRQSGFVVAAGGGIVTREENLDIARQNGKVVYITRPLNQLETEGRPLSGKYGVEALYEARKDLYNEFSEYTFENAGINKTAENIVRELGL